MARRFIFATMLLLATFSAQAQWDFGTGLESYQWQEFGTGSSGNPKESGIRTSALVNWTQSGDGARFAWRAKLYAGTVNYDTFVQSTGAAVSTKTDYGGVVNEGQFLYRYHVGSYGLDQVGGLGLDYWRRSIRNGGGNQIEDYSILFARAGLRLIKSKLEAGFHGELGIKYPISAHENAHLNSAGYTTNPSLAPKGKVSGYAEFGYRIDTKIDLLMYYDSWRFGRSAQVITKDTAGATWGIYQPQSNMDAVGIKLLISL
jgi:hypothetical protein